jgi:glycosyltransferase involved in cell wall biosynthesis
MRNRKLKGKFFAVASVCDPMTFPVQADPRPNISIVTPSFKQLDWLKLCASSIADQEGVTFEHIIQDAHSGPELEQWVRQNTKAQLYVEKDSGMYDAINRGLRRANGDLCAYLNCDEQYLPGTLRRVVDYFDKHPEVDVLFGDSVIVGDTLHPLAYRRVVLPRRWHTMLRPLGVLTCSIFFRRKLVEDETFFDTAWKITGDKAWILSLFDRRYRLAVLPEPLAIFALTGSNLSRHEAVHAERLKWKKSVPTLISLAKPLIRARHIMEKWVHGAYSMQRVDSAWYTFESLTVRRSFTGLTLGWKWPSITSTGTS